MYLRDYLHDIPLKALKAIAKKLDVSVKYEARIKLINAIDHSFWDGTLVEALVKNFSSDHRVLLAIIAFSYDSGISERAFGRKMEKIAGVKKARLSELLDDLISVSLVGGIRGEESRYFCPRGIAEKIRKMFIRDSIAFPDESQPIPTASASNLLEDIYSLLALTYKDTISLTLMGKIKKTLLDRAFAGSPTCSDTRLHFSGDYRDNFIVDYLRKRELLAFEKRRAHTTNRLSGWIDLSMTERLQDITSHAMTTVLQDNFTIVAVTGLLMEIPAGTGLDVQTFAHFLHEKTMAQGGYARLESRMLHFLNILCLLGLFSYAQDRYVMTTTGKLFFTNKSLPFDENVSIQFTTQPNFEIIAGPEIDPRIRFKLELLTTRKNRDMVLTFVINQEGIGRARERGMSPEEVIDFFRIHSRNPVPQNVQFSIESWIRAYGSIYFEDAVLMRFRDAETCQSVAHMPEVTSYIKEQLSDTVLTVSPNYVPAITAILKKALFQPDIYGSRLRDNSRSGVKFTVKTIASLNEDNRLPELHDNFIFPDYFFPNEDTP